MADLTEKQTALPVEIVGSSAGGIESNFVNADANGNLQTKDYSDGTPGSAVPPVALQVGGTDGTNLRAIKTDSSGRPNVDLFDGSGNAITSNSNGNAADQLLHVTTPDTTTASTALGALNATISVSMAGLASAGFQLAAGTLIGTIIPEASVDGGTTWIAVNFYNPTNQSNTASVVFGSANTLTILGIVGFPGVSNLRVRVSAYTSGTANAVLRSVLASPQATSISAAFGTVSNTTVAMAGNTATQLIAANTSRKYLAISNNSGSSMQIQFTNTPAITNTTGLQIPSRSYYEFKGDNLFTGSIFGISASAITVVVVEGTP